MIGIFPDIAPCLMLSAVMVLVHMRMLFDFFFQFMHRGSSKDERISLGGFEKIMQARTRHQSA